jgi:class 3 adenylate cyclase
VAAGPPVRYARNGDVSIAYTVEGSGPLDLLFIGGFAGHLDVVRSWPLGARFFERLAGFARLIQFDKRNQGLSDPGPYTLEDVASDAIAVLDEVGAERVSLFGVSEGGGACTLLAATRPDRIEAMALYGAWARLSRADDYPEGLGDEVLGTQWQEVVEEWGTGEALKLFAPSIADDPVQGDWWGRLLRSGATPAAARAMHEMYVKADVRPLLGSVTVPTLVLWRRHDLVIPARICATIAEGIPGARAIELEGRDHLFLAGDQDSLLDPVEEFLTGRPAARPAERVLTTVLFVDIVDSTRRAAALGDSAWRELLAGFEASTTAAVERGRGRRVKSTGDGLLATFDGPSQAARTALEIGREAAAAGLEIRAGVHTGECELIGDDIGGIAVHIASRIESSASPGEVLASRTVRDLAIGSELTFAERGGRELKGVPGEWELFAVGAG